MSIPNWTFPCSPSLIFHYSADGIPYVFLRRRDLTVIIIYTATSDVTNNTALPKSRKTTFITYCHEDRFISVTPHAYARMCVCVYLCNCVYVCRIRARNYKTVSWIMLKYYNSTQLRRFFAKKQNKNNNLWVNIRDRFWKVIFSFLFRAFERILWKNKTNLKI